MPYTSAHKEHRKLPFLKAFVRIGSITGAAKASRISRDAVHDWRRNDPSFERAFQHAKRKHAQAPFDIVHSAVKFCKDVIKPVIPFELWPKIAAELAIAIAHLERDLKEGRTRRVVPSGETAEVSLLHSRFEDVAIQNCNKGTSASI